MRTLCLLAAFVGLLAASAAALEGKLPPAAQEKASGSNWNLGFINAKGGDLVKTLNSFNVLKVTADADLNAVVVPKIKIEGLNFIAACDAVAASMNAKAFADGEGILISRKAGGPAAGPAGGNAGGNGGNAGGGAMGGGGMGGAAASGGIDWTQKNAFGCKAARKPVVLFVYDKLAKSDDQVLNFFNNSLFMDPNVEKTLAGFTCIKLDSTSTLWPKDMMQRAKTAGVVFLLTCEGAPLNAWDRAGGIPTVKSFLEACQRASDANAKIVEKYVKEDEAKQADEDKKKKDNTVGGIPGLGGKTEEKSQDPAKTGGKVEDEAK
ncbi:MAG: hypothetical protein KIS92_02395 [Planctomycetota bacterium]|nr:hypothetical protein [Planctomycetota bacterium]